MEQDNNKVAVVGFSKKSSPLEPVWPSTHRALLPISGKAIVIHVIETLMGLGYKHIRIAGSLQQWAVRKVIGDGAEWGITIRYSDLESEDLKGECLATYGECLYALGDKFDMSFSTLNEENIDLLNGINNLYKNDISSVFDYHQTNLNVIKQINKFNIPGARIHSDNAFADWNNKISPSAYIGKNTFIGKHNYISNNVSLEENCILSHGVLIGKNTKLKNVTVLTNSSIGANLALSDCVITPLGIFDFNDRFWPIQDSHIITKTRNNKEDITGLPTLNKEVTAL